MLRKLVPLVALLGAGSAWSRPADAPVAVDGVINGVERAAFSVRWRGLTSGRRLNPLFTRPGEPVRIEAVGGGPFTLTADAGVLRQVGPGAWMWTAPGRTGPLRLVVRDGAGDSIMFQAVVAVPATEVVNGRLRGYRIDAYPSGDGSARRPAAPRGFLEVTPELRSLRVSPRLRLGQFLCKQESGWPKFVVIDERLVLALEDLADGLASRGFTATLTLMSAYRTPFYNAGLGNVRTSRHVYGQAADIFLDVRPADGVMDDLNRDGRVDRRDADHLARLIDEILGGTRGEFAGGVGRYGRNASHGPFVHIDVRGYRARW